MGKFSQPLFLVHSVSILVPVCPDQQHGLPNSAALFCFGAVIQHSFCSNLLFFSVNFIAPVHLVSPLEFSQFQEECNYLDQIAAACFFAGLLQGSHISIEALSVPLRSASSNMQISP